MNFKIKNIRVQNLRGIRNMELSIDGKNLILVGGNGSGKSSLVDALEYYFTGHVRQLEGRADVDKRKCLPNLNGGQTKICLVFKGLGSENGITVCYPNRRASIPRDFHSFFRSVEPKPFVLRRHQLLDFINARDGERYQVISYLIGLESLDKIESNWRMEFRKLEKSSSELASKRKQIYRRLESLLGQSVKTKELLLSIVNMRLCDLELEPVNNFAELKLRLGYLREFSQISEDGDKIRQFSVLRTEILKLKDFANNISEIYQQLKESVELFLEYSQELDESDFEPLLSVGYRFLRECKSVSICPLCESPIQDFDALVLRVAERLQVLSDLVKGREKIKCDKQSLIVATEALKNKLEEIGKLLKEYNFIDNLPQLRELWSFFNRWQVLVKQENINVFTELDGQLEKNLGELQSLIPVLLDNIQQQIELLSPNKSDATVLNLFLTLVRVDEQWQELQHIEYKMHKTEYVQNQVEMFCDALVGARKRGLKRISSELQSDFEKLYTELHPDEGYDDVTLNVQELKRRSVALRVKFYENDATHPLNYLSEGHLDSLGFCIFLAFMKRYNSDFKFIVLDDVWSAVDAEHRLRVAKLLAREFSDYQFVITTHDRLWAQELKFALPQSKLFYLRPWSFELGSDCQSSLISDWEYYKQQARSGHPQDAIAGAGRNLEKFLYQMRNNLHLSVPAKPGDNYTIGDLYSPFFNWLHKHKIERLDYLNFDEEICMRERELDEVWRLRNWSGAHFNNWAAGVSSDEALSFISAIENLVNCFSCPVCHGLVVYDKQACVLVCPYCQPTEILQSVAFQYKPNWIVNVNRMLHLNNPKIRKQIPSMLEGVFAGFVHDMYYRLQLSLPIFCDKKRGFCSRNLYMPLFEWAVDHPRPGVPNWERIIGNFEEILSVCCEVEQRMHIPDSKIEDFVRLMKQTVELFTCNIDGCQQLLDYKDGVYICTKCNGQELIPNTVSAYWFVSKP